MSPSTPHDRYRNLERFLQPLTKPYPPSIETNQKQQSSHISSPLQNKKKHQIVFSMKFLKKYLFKDTLILIIIWNELVTNEERWSVVGIVFAKGILRHHNQFSITHKSMQVNQQFFDISQHATHTMSRSFTASKWEDAMGRESESPWEQDGPHIAALAWWILFVSAPQSRVDHAASTTVPLLRLEISTWIFSSSSYNAQSWLLHPRIPTAIPTDRMWIKVVETSGTRHGWILKHSNNLIQQTIKVEWVNYHIRTQVYLSHKRNKEENGCSQVCDKLFHHTEKLNKQKKIRDQTRTNYQKKHLIKL